MSERDGRRARKRTAKPKLPTAAQTDLTETERQANERLADRRRKAPKVVLQAEAGNLTLSVVHRDEATGRALYLQSLGTHDGAFADTLLRQLVNVASKGQQIDTEATTFALGIVRGVEPEDQVETLLASQMAAVHLATMSMARRLSHAETLPQQDSAERALNKLARTFATQVEALKRYRRGGEQRVLVQHVNVEDGGQAVVGNVTAGRGEGAS